MTPRALNVLRHPRRPWSLRGLPGRVGLHGQDRHRLAGLALGWFCALGLGWAVQAQRGDLLRMQRERAQEQAVQAARAAEQRAAQARQRLQAQQQAWWRSQQAQQQRLLALQSALQREAEQGLRLQRWQADGQGLWLQGQLPQAQTLPALQARLGEALGQPWRLHSLGKAPSPPSLSWTLQAPWPSASAPRTTP